MAKNWKQPKPTDPTCTTLVSLFVSEVVEEFLCLGADFRGGGDLLAADLDGDVS